MPPTPLPPRRPIFPSEPPKRRFNRFAIYLALGVALIFIPLTLQFQNHRAREIRSAREKAHPTPAPTPPSVEEVGDQSVPAELRQWHMQGVDGITESQARKRFATPILTRDYNVTYGAFLGPKYGLKHYYLNNSPGFEQRAKAAQVEWNFPQYSTVREMIWKLRESLHHPLAGPTPPGGEHPGGHRQRHFPGQPPPANGWCSTTIASGRTW